MATVKQVLEQVDAMLPNQYTTAEKRRWLLQAEGFVVREVHQPHAGGEEAQVPPEDAGEDTVLLVQPPYDELYRHYVEAQIHYANGEMERYNNAWCRLEQRPADIPGLLVPQSYAPAGGEGAAADVRGMGCFFRK